MTGKNTLPALLVALALTLAACTQEQQNKFGRGVQNWTGTDGVVDENFNWSKDPGEKKVYFEISDYSTSYVFYENYRN